MLHHAKHHHSSNRDHPQPSLAEPLQHHDAAASYWFCYQFLHCPAATPVVKQNSCSLVHGLSLAAARPSQCVASHGARWSQTPCMPAAVRESTLGQQHSTFVLNPQSRTCLCHLLAHTAFSIMLTGMRHGASSFSSSNQGTCCIQNDSSI